MKPLHTPNARFPSPYYLIGLILIVSASLMGVVLVLHLWKGIPIGKLTRNPVAIGNLPVYTGFISQIGIFFWSASATACFHSLIALPKQKTTFEIRTFLLISGLLTLLLAIDDVFLIHESMLVGFGIPENLVLGSYVGFVFLYLVAFYPLILKTEYGLMALALFFLGLSVIMDVLPFPGINPYFFKDGAKLIGLVSWTAYFFRVGNHVGHPHGNRHKRVLKRNALAASHRQARLPMDVPAEFTENRASDATHLR